MIIPGWRASSGSSWSGSTRSRFPDDLLDAARIDGAGEFRIYWSIVLPLIRPILVTLAIFTFLATWNDFMWPLIVLSDESKYTLPVALANLSGEHVQDTELMMAGSVVTVLPVLAVFLVLQRYYIQGVHGGEREGMRALGAAAGGGRRGCVCAPVARRSADRLSARRRRCSTTSKRVDAWTASPSDGVAARREDRLRPDRPARCGSTSTSRARRLRHRAARRWR